MNFFLFFGEQNWPFISFVYVFNTSIVTGDIGEIYRLVKILFSVLNIFDYTTLVRVNSLHPLKVD